MGTCSFGTCSFDISEILASLQTLTFDIPDINPNGDISTVLSLHGFNKLTAGGIEGKEFMYIAILRVIALRDQFWMQKCTDIFSILQKLIAKTSTIEQKITCAEGSINEIFGIGTLLEKRIDFQDKKIYCLSSMVRKIKSIPKVSVWQDSARELRYEKYAQRNKKSREKKHYKERRHFNLPNSPTK